MGWLRQFARSDSLIRPARRGAGTVCSTNAALQKMALVHLHDAFQTRLFPLLVKKAMPPQERRAVDDSATLDRLMQRRPLLQAFLKHGPFRLVPQASKFRSGQGMEDTSARRRAASKPAQACRLPVSRDPFRSTMPAYAQTVQFGFLMGCLFGQLFALGRFLEIDCQSPLLRWRQHGNPVPDRLLCH